MTGRSRRPLPVSDAIRPYSPPRPVTWPEGPSDGQLADHVQELADRMGGWLSASVFVNTPLYPEHGDKCSAELEEWCRSARDLLWAYAGMLRAGDPE